MKGKWVVRLTKVELVKAVTSRVNQWALIGSVAASLALAILMVVVQVRFLGKEVELVLLASGMMLSLPLISPFLAILVFTGDWQHRATSTYFPLVPGRSPIYVAKLLAVAGLTLGLLLSTSALALAVWGAAGIFTGEFVVGDDLVGQLQLTAIIASLGAAFGAGWAAILRKPLLTWIGMTVAGVAGLSATLALNSLHAPAVAQEAVSNLSVLGYLILQILPTEVGAVEEETISATGAGLSFLIWYVLPMLVGWRIHQKADA